MSCSASRMRSRVVGALTLETLPAGRYGAGWTVQNGGTGIDSSDAPLPPGVRAPRRGARPDRRTSPHPPESRRRSRGNMTSAVTGRQPTGRTVPKAGAREWIGLAVLVLPVLLIAIDMTVLGFAVPYLTEDLRPTGGDRKSTRLNSSHVKSSYAVFCLKKKKITHSMTFTVEKNN